MTISKPVKIGIFVTVVFVSGIWGLFYLRGLDLFSKETKYYIVYENIQGLVSSNPVQIKGLKVGQVSNITFTDGQYNNIVVEIIIKHGYKIPKGSIGKIYSADLMGSKSIEIITGKSLEYMKDGDTLQSDIEKSLQEQVRLEVLPIKKKAESLMSSMDSIFSGIEYVFNKKTQENIMTSISNIKKTFENLEYTTRRFDTIISSGNITSIIKNVDAITTTIKLQNKNITKTIANISTISDTLVKMNVSRTLLSANHSLLMFDSIVTKINQGDGTLGQLIKNETLYNDMKTVSKSLDSLLIDVQKNPKRYVHFSIFGSNSGTKTSKRK